MPEGSWSATATLSAVNTYHGYDARRRTVYGAITDNTFDDNETEYTIQALNVQRGTIWIYISSGTSEGDRR